MNKTDKKLQHKKIKKSDRAGYFSLAEILLGLTIIGIIALETIPGFISGIQDQQYKTMYKKIYSELSQSYSKMQNDLGANLNTSGLLACGSPSSPSPYGAYSASKTGIATTTNIFNSALFINCFAPHLSYAKLGQGGTIWHQNTEKLLNGDFAITLSGYAPLFTSNTFHGFVLSNGAIIIGRSNLVTSNASCVMYRTCELGSIIIDVNGYKSPNTIGKDIYVVYIKKTGLVPIGSGSSNDSAAQFTNCTNNSWGFGCSTKYLIE